MHLAVAFHAADFPHQVVQVALAFRERFFLVEIGFALGFQLGFQLPHFHFGLAVAVFFLFHLLAHRFLLFFQFGSAVYG